VTFLAIVLGAGLIWVIFFSGLIIQKKQMQTPIGETPSPAPSQDSGVVKQDTVVFETNYGTFKVKLDLAAAPKTSANMQKLVSEKFYDGLTFHRVIDGFMIQGGDPKGDGTGGPNYTVPAEIGLPHKRGVIATARTSDQFNPTRASSGSQFFITLTDASDETLASLDAGGYTVFGQVVSGMDVVDKIGKVATGDSDKPVKPVIINHAILINE